MTPSGSGSHNCSDGGGLSDRPFYHYELYGITLRSEIRLSFPETAFVDSPDVSFVLVPPGLFERALVGLENLSSPDDWYERYVCADGSVLLRWPGLFQFLVSADGTSVACDMSGAASEESFQTYQLGHVLSYALVKQGHEPLHATAVVVDGGAFAFLGRSGRGKSTLAASFVKAGYRVLTDDLLRLQDIDGVLCGHPGPPRIKVFEEIAHKILPEQSAVSRLNPDSGKLILALGPRQYCATAVRLLGFFAIAESTACERDVDLAALTPAESMLELVHSTFNSRLRGSDRMTRQFLAAKEWCTRVPVQRLAYPRTLAGVASVIDALQLYSQSALACVV